LAEHIEAQTTFHDTELKPRLDAAQAGEGHLFFVDAAHFVFGTFLCCLWSFKRIFVRAASGRQRFNVLGAWNAMTRELIAVTNTTVVNTETMCELLRKIATLGLTGPITPPTMLQRTLLGASLKRGRTDPIHDADLLLVDLDLLHQSTNDLPSRVPVRLLQLLGNASRELLQLADHQPQFHFLVGLVNPLPTLILQLGQALSRRQDPRLEFRLVEQPVAVGIDQS
jgi:hypothetical protein